MKRYSLRIDVRIFALTLSRALLLALMFSTSAHASGAAADETRESYFGRAPARFRALEDEEGREVDFRTTDFARGRHPASVSDSDSDIGGGRRPASAKPRLDEAPEPTRISRELAEEDARVADAIADRNARAPAPSTEDKVYRRPSRSIARVSDDADLDGNVNSPVNRAPNGATARNAGDIEFSGARGISSLRMSDGSAGIGASSHDGASVDSLAWNREETKLKDPFAAADSVTRRKGVQEISIIANDLGFYPRTVFVSRSVPVRMYVTGASKNSTCLMMDAFNVRKQLRPNKVEEITFVPNQAGTYRFYCPVNNSDGVLVVKELSPSNEKEGT